MQCTTILQQCQLRGHMKKLLASLIFIALSTPSLAEVSVDMEGIKSHYSKYNKAKLPVGDTVFVCSAYGCKVRHDFLFQDRELNVLKEYFSSVNSASSEREALRKAIAFIETRVGIATDTDTDRASIDFLGNGDATQMDCVDEATNVTSYLLILKKHGMIKHHDILAPNWKGGIFKWTHYAGVIKDRKTGINWAIDAGVGGNGKRPLIIEYSKWYN